MGREWDHRTHAESTKNETKLHTFEGRGGGVGSSMEPGFSGAPWALVSHGALGSPGFHRAMGSVGAHGPVIPEVP